MDKQEKTLWGLLVIDIVVVVYLVVAVTVILFAVTGCGKITAPTMPMHEFATPTPTPEISVWLPDPDRMGPPDPDSGKGRLQ